MGSKPDGSLLWQSTDLTATRTASPTIGPDGRLHFGSALAPFHLYAIGA